MMLANSWSSFKTWGASNNQGWCLSTDKSNWNNFGGGKVPAKTCYYKLKFTPSGKAYGWVRPERAHATSDATSCRGWDCTVEGQYCPPGVPGSSDVGYCCKNKKWNAGQCGHRRLTE